MILLVCGCYVVFIGPIAIIEIIFRWFRMILLVCGCYVVFVGPIAVVNMTDAEGEKSGCLKLIYFRL